MTINSTLSAVLAYLGTQQYTVSTRDLSALLRLEDVLGYRGVVVIAANVFMPASQKILFSLSLSVPFPIKARGTLFLKRLKEKLDHQDLSLVVTKSQLIDISWSIEYPELFLGDVPPAICVAELEEVWSSYMSLGLTCIQILNLCARISKRGGGSLEYTKLTPSRLAALCLCDHIDNSIGYHA